MKTRSAISVFVLLLAALLWGCGGGHDARVTAELDRADSLLRTSDTAAHSAALRQMLALDTARALQADEALRARHALLLVQARYKCYATEEADSALIDTAYRYYADHHSSSADHERYTRTLIYQGAVSEELGHPQQAIRHYKQAEFICNRNDYDNLAQINFRLGELYRAHFVGDGYALSKYKKALELFKITENYNYQLSCEFNIGGLLRLSDRKEANNHLIRAVELATVLHDTINHIYASELLSKSFLMDSLYLEAKNTAINVIKDYPSSISDDILYDATIAFAKLGLNDSACFYFNQTNPNPVHVTERINRFYALSELAAMDGDYHLQIKYDQMGDALADSLATIKREPKLQLEENVIVENALSKQEGINKSISIITFLASALFLFVLALFIFKHYYNKKKWHSLINQLHNSQAEIRTNYSRLMTTTKRFDALRPLLVQHFNLMDKLLKLGDSNPNNKIASQLRNTIHSTYSNKCFVKEMRHFIYNQADETLKDFLTSTETVLNSLENDVITFTACGFSSPEIAILTNQKDASYVRVIRHRIAKKLNLNCTVESFLSSHFIL